MIKIKSDCKHDYKFNYCFVFSILDDNVLVNVYYCTKCGREKKRVN